MAREALSTAYFEDEVYSTRCFSMDRILSLRRTYPSYTRWSFPMTLPHSSSARRPAEGTFRIDVL